MVKRQTRKYSPEFKAKVALAAARGTGRFPSWPVTMEFLLVR